MFRKPIIDNSGNKMFQESFQSQNYLFFLVCLVPFSLALWKIWRTSTILLDPQEPPLLSSRIPYFGHLIGLIQRPNRYLFELHEKTNHPISTLQMLNGKVYVINSPHLVQASFRNKELSFAPLVNEYVSRMDELSSVARRTYTENGMHERMMLLFQKRMAGGPVKQMKIVAIDEINSILQQSSQPHDITGINVESLWIWIRDIMTTVTTTALLGAHDPWKNSPSLIESYWAWESGDISRRTPLAAIKDRASHQGRIAIQKALAVYFANDEFSKRSDSNHVAHLTSETAAMQKQYDFSADDLAAAYTQVIHASLMNVVPTTFWVLVHIYSRPELIATLRQEAISTMKEEDSRDGSSTRYMTIDFDRLNTLCPTLLAVFREAHRLASVGTLHRRVLVDTYLQDGDANGRTYLLKKGVTVMIPTTVSLRDTHLWGNDNDQFDAERFLPQSKAAHSIDNSTKTSSSEFTSNLRKKAYFPFGGGKELCPGRNFATAEVMSILVVLLSGFDITAPNGGKLSVPQAAEPKLTTSTAKPAKDADLRARISRRPGWEQVVWHAARADLTTEKIL